MACGNALGAIGNAEAAAEAAAAELRAAAAGAAAAARRGEPGGVGRGVSGRLPIESPAGVIDEERDEDDGGGAAAFSPAALMLLDTAMAVVRMRPSPAGGRTRRKTDGDDAFWNLVAGETPSGDSVDVGTTNLPPFTCGLVNCAAWGPSVRTEDHRRGPLAGLGLAMPPVPAEGEPFSAVG